MTESRIREAASILLANAPGSRVILFGSHARGDARPDSDLDFLVVEPEVTRRRREMVRLADVLRERGIYADIIVLSAEQFDEWADVPGGVVHDAAREGRVFSGSS